MDISAGIAYKDFIARIIENIRSAQYAALKAVNKEQINLYWEIGKQIVEKQNELKWGKSVVEQLVKDIQKEFPDINGFSSRNLWLMRQFYEMYSKSEILQPLVAEIGWSHYIQIISKCSNDYKVLEKHFLLINKLKNI